MTVLKTITQRLFGRTVIDSLDLNQNAWYIDEEQVTATAAQINASGVVNPALLVAASIDEAADDVVFLDATDSLVKKDTFKGLAAVMSGKGMINLDGTIGVSDSGTMARGGVFFTGIGDCTKITVSGIDYVVDPAPDVTIGEWAVGGSAAASATNLAAAINGDERNAGGPFFNAIAQGDGVEIYGLTVGVSSTAVITRTGGAQPSTLQNFDVATGEVQVQFTSIWRDVTALDALLPAITIPMAFEPMVFVLQVRTIAGVIKNITSQVTTVPEGLRITVAGATNIAATDILYGMAMTV